jgi:flagellar basal body-associated protein FliL
MTAPPTSPTGFGPPPGYQQTAPTGFQPVPPGSAPPYPGSAPPDQYPPYGWPPPAPAPRRRGGLIAVIVVAIVVVLGGGAGLTAYLLNRNSDGTGKSSASAAAEGFLEAVYNDQDAGKVAPFVCSAARDSKKISTKINEIKQQGQQYEKPKYTFSLSTDRATNTQATITATVTLTTDNEQKATQKLRLTVIKSTGWFVCEVQQV